MSTSTYRAKTVLEKIRQEDGITLEYINNSLDIFDVDDGYIIGVETVYKIPFDTVDHYDMVVILDNLIENLQDDYLVEFWVDDGVLYCEYSKHETSFELAMSVGEANSQECIYKCSDGSLIYL